MRQNTVMGHFGFSYVGLLYLLMLFVPNILWARYPPQGYSPKGESRILGLLERGGQVGVTVCSVIFRDYDPTSFSLWSLWFIASSLAMVLYEVCWVRYFRSSRHMDDFYRSFLGIPVPLAVLPVLAFLLLGVYGRVIWLIAATLVLGIGHIGIHLQHRREL